MADYAAWGHLADTLRTGRPGFEQAFGTDFFAHLSRDEAAAEHFDRFMVAASRRIAHALPVARRGSRGALRPLHGRGVAAHCPRLAGMLRCRDGYLNISCSGGRINSRALPSPRS